MGAWAPVQMGSRALNILSLLLDQPGALVSKDELMDVAWPNLAVAPNNLTVQMAALRRVLDEGRPGESCIQTVPRRGYRFILGVTHAAETGPSRGSAPADLPSVQIESPTRASCASTPSTAVTSAPTQDRRQSVIVLPFKNSSGDPAQDGLADQMTHELTERISRITPTPVIPEMTAAAYRGREVDLKAIGRRHDVHFVLVGSARRQDGRLIASAILYETAGGRNVWSRQFDRPDGRDAQQAIVQAIDESFWEASVNEEAECAMRERPNNMDPRDLVLMALTTRLHTPTKANSGENRADRAGARPRPQQSPRA